MFKDDDEEEENTFGVTRYPCMPSLVALQQMRNRLHLAFLGRKLMKWTALATGREMRRLAQELYEVYQGFGEDMRNAFILLARSRYFCPMLNDIVTEDIGKKAGVIVQPSYKTISGVKIVQFEIFETEVPPYAHLGLEKGGQSILEAKKAWLDILKRLIMMMQLRASFLMVELANKNATKKMNVLKKIVIPRLNVTNTYILMELEEIAREEFSRLKKVKEKKKRDKAEFDNIDKVPDIKDIDVESKTRIMEDNEKLFVDNQNASSSKFSTASSIVEEKLIEVKKYFDEITLQAKELINNGDNTNDTSNFLEKYEKAKQIISQLLDRANYKKFDELIDEKVEYLKSYLREAASIKENYDNNANVNVSKSENELQKTYTNASNGVYFPKKEKTCKECNVELEEFRDIVTGVEKITSAYIKQGLLSPSMEKFVQSCNEVKLKLDKCKSNVKSTFNVSNKSLNKLGQNTSTNNGIQNLSTNNDIDNKNHYRNKLNVDEIMNLIDNLNLEGNIDGLTRTPNLEPTKQSAEEECDCIENSESKSLHEFENNIQFKSTSTETIKNNNFNNISCRKVCKKVCFMCSRSLDKDSFKENRCEICKNEILKNDDVKIKRSEETQTFKGH